MTRRLSAKRSRALWTDHFSKQAKNPEPSADLQLAPEPAPASRRPVDQHKAKGRLKSGERNRTEAAYEHHLELRKQVGEVVWYAFEAITLKLAENVRWTPDFAVLRADGILELHDVKGTTSVERKAGRVKAPYVMEDARVKGRVAAQMFPLVVKVVYKVDGNWIEKEY